MKIENSEFKTCCLFVAVFFFSSIVFASAQHVPVPEETEISPEIQFLGTGVATLKGDWPSSGPSQSSVNFTDSAFLLGGTQALYDEALGGFTFGSLVNDKTQNGQANSSLFVHQVIVTYQDRSFEAFMGRHDVATARFVQFPTIREDDILSFASYLNPYSNGASTEEHRYANVASITFNQDFKAFENIHVQKYIHSAAIPDNGNIDSVGVSIERMTALPGLEPLHRVVNLGLGYERVQLLSPTGVHNVVYGGGVINLNESVTDRFDLRVQDIFVSGIRLSGFQNLTDTYLSDSNSVTASLRFLKMPFGTPGYQVALTGAYKSYPGISNSDSWAGVLTGVKMLGHGFDLVGQYLYQSRGQMLANQYSGISTEQAVEVGMIFNFESTFNKHLTPRRSLLNMEHQYVPNK